MQNMVLEKLYHQTLLLQILENYLNVLKHLSKNVLNKSGTDVNKNPNVYWIGISRYLMKIIREKAIPEMQ